MSCLTLRFRRKILVCILMVVCVTGSSQVAQADTNEAMDIYKQLIAVLLKNGPAPCRHYVHTVVLLKTSRSTVSNNRIKTISTVLGWLIGEKEDSKGYFLPKDKWTLICFNDQVGTPATPPSNLYGAKLRDWMMAEKEKNLQPETREGTRQETALNKALNEANRIQKVNSSEAVQVLMLTDQDESDDGHIRQLRDQEKKATLKEKDLRSRFEKTGMSAPPYTQKPENRIVYELLVPKEAKNITSLPDTLTRYQLESAPTIAAPDILPHFDSPPTPTFNPVPPLLGIIGGITLIGGGIAFWLAMQEWLKQNIRLTIEPLEESRYPFLGIRQLTIRVSSLEWRPVPRFPSWVRIPNLAASPVTTIFAQAGGAPPSGGDVSIVLGNGTPQPIALIRGLENLDAARIETPPNLPAYLTDETSVQMNAISLPNGKSSLVRVGLDTNRSVRLRITPELQVEERVRTRQRAKQEAIIGGVLVGASLLLFIGGGYAANSTPPPNQKPLSQIVPSTPITDVCRESGKTESKP